MLPTCAFIYLLEKEAGYGRIRGLFKKPSLVCQSSLLRETSTEAFLHIHIRSSKFYFMLILLIFGIKFRLFHKTILLMTIKHEHWIFSLFYKKVRLIKLFWHYPEIWIFGGNMVCKFLHILVFCRKKKHIMDLRTKQTFDRKNQEAKQKRNEAAEKRR